MNHNKSVTDRSFIFKLRTNINWLQVFEIRNFREKALHFHCDVDSGFKLQLRLYKKVSEYDQEIPQSQTADQPTAP